MEIKAILKKPFTNKERIDFIIQYNHKQGLIINEIEEELQALGYTDEELDEQKEIAISKLKLTKREVFLALYKDSGITPDVIKNAISDPAILIEFEYANDYYRGNPLIDMIGESLGYSKEDLDYLFMNKTLPPKEEGANV